LIGQSPAATPIPAISPLTIKSSSLSPPPEDQINEFFVKWRNKAYVHCEWVPESQILQNEGCYFILFYFLFLSLLG